MNKRVLPIVIALSYALTASAQYTLSDWKIKDFNPNNELKLNVSEYKLVILQKNYMLDKLIRAAKIIL